MSASVVAGCDTAPILEAAEHVLDTMALAIERLVERDFHLSAARLRDTGSDAPFEQRGAEAIAVVAAIGEQFAGWRQSRQHHRGALVITHLALGEEQHDGPTMAVADGVQFRVQAAFGAADATRKSPFCSRLAAVRCAFRCVASIISRSGVSASAASAAKMRAKTPSRLQRTKRL